MDVLSQTERKKLKNGRQFTTMNYITYTMTLLRIGTHTYALIAVSFHSAAVGVVYYVYDMYVLLCLSYSSFC